MPDSTGDLAFARLLAVSAWIGIGDTHAFRMVPEGVMIQVEACDQAYVARFSSSSL